MELEQYVAAVVAGESSVFRSEEALKAMAVAARTYAARFRNRHATEGFDLCDTTHCQRLDMSQISARTTAAAQRTAGEILEYRGQPALTYYTRDCGGFIEDVRSVWPEENAPYLKSKPDSSCGRGTESPWHWEINGRELAEVLRRSELRAPSRIERITVVERAPGSGRAKVVALMGGGESVRISASSLRFAVGRAFGFNSIASDQYKVGVAGERLVFDGLGSGHGVGLCQHGADQMGSQGRSYRDILAFYFPGTTIGTRKELTWRRVSGERIALFTTQPDQDGFALPIAERLLRSAEQRMRLTAPQGLEIRAFPNVAEFIRATGEPGWVAARTTRREIQMQPPAILRDKGALETTLRHEMLHVMIEANGRSGLPVWFREGLVEYLSDSSDSGAGSTRDRDLRQTADEARARAAYKGAGRQVRTLVARYGETAVLGWLATGLPREVTNAANKQAATKSK
jgi:stage II sporulation protein D